MKKIRTLLLGVMIGGALGTELMIHFSTLMGIERSLNVIETGFASGAVLGLVLSLLILGFEKPRSESSKSEFGALARN